MCELERRDFWVSSPADIANLYTHTWNATGPRNTSGTGENFSIYSRTPPGTYTITVTRRFNPGSGVIGPASSYSRVFTVFPTTHPTYGCNEGDDNDGDGWPDPIARIAMDSDTLQTTIQDQQTTFTNINVWPNPVKGKLNVTYEMVEDGDISIRLVPLLQSNQPEVTITDSFRPVGKYQETYYTDYLRNGMYLLIIQANNQNIKRKIIINK